MNVLELFAGVGGFRIGLENADKKFFRTRWSNQWEPSRKSQDAFEVYDYRFPDSENINLSISEISDEKFASMNADIIVGGFPCQDYSVARSKKNEQGIQGKKGVLFWDIIRATKIIKPKYLVLENVDRLLKAPSKQRGRDFAIMLVAFNDLGYSVEWRVINAADYGRSQRRRRIFFFIYRNDTDYAKSLDSSFENKEFNSYRYDDYILASGLFASQFPVQKEIVKNRRACCRLIDDIAMVSDSFTGVFWNAGVMRHGKYYSVDTTPNFNGSAITLGEILQKPEEIDERFYVTDLDKISKFQYLRGSKKIERISANGHTYIYSEGAMSPFDNLELPARTMLTTEGMLNRSTHFLSINGRYRLLTPVEAERLQDFPDNWTAKKRSSDGNVVNVSDKMRMFFMGNALVTDIVQKIAEFIKYIECAINEKG